MDVKSGILRLKNICEMEYIFTNSIHIYQYRNRLMHYTLNGTFEQIIKDVVGAMQEIAEFVEKEVIPDLPQEAQDVYKRQTLESAAVFDEKSGRYILRAGDGSTGIFIYPGYEFKLVDGLITNFHLPKSTLLMLISALYDRDEILKAYTLAVREKYRFFSYGDAMLII